MLNCSLAHMNDGETISLVYLQLLVNSQIAPIKWVWGGVSLPCPRSEVLRTLGADHHFKSSSRISQRTFLWDNLQCRLWKHGWSFHSDWCFTEHCYKSNGIAERYELIERWYHWLFLDIYTLFSIFRAELAFLGCTWKSNELLWRFLNLWS